MEQCKIISEERDLLKKELAELRTATHAVVIMVDLVEGVIENRTQVECLREAPQKISSYLTEMSKQYVAHVLGLVKSYWPQVRLTPLGDGMEIECTEDRFIEYVEEAKPVAARIVEMLEQESEAEV